MLPFYRKPPVTVPRHEAWCEGALRSHPHIRQRGLTDPRQRGAPGESLGRDSARCRRDSLLLGGDAQGVLRPKVLGTLLALRVIRERRVARDTLGGRTAVCGEQSDLIAVRHADQRQQTGRARRQVHERGSLSAGVVLIANEHLARNRFVASDGTVQIVSQIAILGGDRERAKEETFRLDLLDGPRLDGIRHIVIGVENLNDIHVSFPFERKRRETFPTRCRNMRLGAERGIRSPWAEGEALARLDPSPVIPRCQFSSRERILRCAPPAK